MLSAQARQAGLYTVFATHDDAHLPFGTDWWPNTIRRVGESPRNLFHQYFSAGGGYLRPARPTRGPVSGAPP